MLAIIPSATLLGIEGHAVNVEVHVGQGLPGFTLVGLPDTTCREARDRVRAALISAGFSWPQGFRTTVNLAPSGLRKGGASLDLAIAIGLLVATEELTPVQVHGCSFIGELGLDGSLRPPVGSLPLAAALSTHRVIVPAAADADSRLIAGDRIRSATRLDQVVYALKGERPWPNPPPAPARHSVPSGPDLCDVSGQMLARRALEVAAAGGHHLLMIGPPGSGKTMLASRLAGLLPDLDSSTALETTCVHSAAGMNRLGGGLIRRPPLRAPHHTATPVSLVGGGTATMRPGEISLANGGVLFLDELGEFPPAALDALRQPLEEGVIRVTRAAASVTLPARFLLIAAMNPCPCGEGLVRQACRCTDAGRARYARRISGPMLDRFDLRIDVLRPSSAELLGRPTSLAESSALVRERVENARARMVTRQGCLNVALPDAALDNFAPLTPNAVAVLRRELDRGRLSARGLRRIRTVALTLIDLAADDAPIGEAMIHSALSLRTTPGCLSPLQAAR